MNRTQAMSILKKLIGKNLRYRENPKAPNAEEKLVLRERHKEADEKQRAARAALDERRKVVLDADTEYVRLLAEYQATVRAKESIGSPYRDRIQVGTVTEAGSFSFFSIKFTGDNWAEVVGKARTKELNKT